MSEEEKEKLLKKWSAAGFGDGIDPLSVWGNTTVTTATQATPSEFPSVFPIVRQVFAKTIASELVSVSPMDPPGLWNKKPIEQLAVHWPKLKKAMQNHPLWKAIEEASGGTRETLKESLYNIPEIKSLRDKVRDLMKKAFEGLNESKIEEHLNDIEKMDKLLKIGKVSDKFGV